MRTRMSGARQGVATTRRSKLAMHWQDSLRCLCVSHMSGATSVRQ